MPVRPATVVPSNASIPAGAVRLEGELLVPDDALGVVAFSHGSGSGRHSPRNQLVAAELRKAASARCSSTC